MKKLEQQEGRKNVAQLLKIVRRADNCRKIKKYDLSSKVHSQKKDEECKIQLQI